MLNCQCCLLNYKKINLNVTDLEMPLEANFRRELDEIFPWYLVCSSQVQSAETSSRLISPNSSSQERLYYLSPQNNFNVVDLQPQTVPGIMI